MPDQDVLSGTEEKDRRQTADTSSSAAAKPAAQKQKSGISSGNKFFFDNHNFDEGPVSLEPEPEEPPPPMFSSQELQQAKKNGYEQGFRDGKHESDTSRERHVADLMEIVSGRFAELFSAEQARNTRYEREAVELCVAVFKQVFPALNEQHGLAELERVIGQVLEAGRERTEIIVEVAPDFAEPVREYIEDKIKKDGLEGTCTVKANDTMGAGDCRMSWKDGGAQRQAQKLSEQVLKHLEDTLAERPVLHDNRKEERSVPAQDIETEITSLPHTETGQNATPPEHTDSGDAETEKNE